jgi:hypothetical protein
MQAVAKRVEESNCDLIGIFSLLGSAFQRQDLFKATNKISKVNNFFT